MTTSDGPARSSPPASRDDASRRSRRARWLSLAGVAVAAIVVVLVVCQPRKLILDVEVDEALPGLVRPADAGSGGGTPTSATLRSVVIWCEPFSVAFGDAPLVRA